MIFLVQCARDWAENDRHFVDINTPGDLKRLSDFFERDLIVSFDDSQIFPTVTVIDDNVEYNCRSNGKTMSDFADESGVETEPEHSDNATDSEFYEYLRKNSLNE